MMTFLRRFLFEPAPAEQLGLCRVLYFGALFLLYLRTEFSHWGDVSPAFVYPLWFFRLLHLPILPPMGLLALSLPWKASLLLACAGLWTRAATWVAFLLGTYLLGIPQNFGKVHHADTLVAITLGILALSRCGDAISLDKLRRDWGNRRRLTSPPPHWEYGWPIRLVWALMGTVFGAAAYSKLLGDPWSWVASDYMQLLCLAHTYPGMSDSAPLARLTLLLAGSAALCKITAAASLLAETAMPLAVFSGTVRMLVPPALFMMQGSIFLFLGIDFTPFMASYVFWAPWTTAVQSAAGWGSALRCTLLYDGGCGLCSRTVFLVRAVDLFGWVRTLDVMTEWHVIARLHPGLSQDACLEEMHLLGGSGEVHTGFSTYRQLAWRLPLLWPTLPWLYVPGVPWLGRKIYAEVARRRTRGVCQIGTA